MPPPLLAQIVSIAVGRNAHRFVTLLTVVVTLFVTVAVVLGVVCETVTHHTGQSSHSRTSGVAHRCVVMCVVRRVVWLTQWTVSVIAGTITECLTPPSPARECLL